MIEEGRRVYPVNSKRLTRRLSQDFSSKTLNNRRTGVNSMLSGEYKPFIGFKEDTFSKLFGFGLIPETASETEIMQRVVSPLQSLAKKHNVPAIFAGVEDLSPHVTLHVGSFKEMSPEDMSSVHDWLNSGSSHLRWVSEILCGLSFHMDTLVMGAPNSYLSAGKFDDEQGAPYRARMIFEEILQRSISAVAKNSQPISGTIGTLYPRYDDIFHLSVSRLTEIRSGDVLSMYAIEANATVGEELQRNPITFTVGEVISGLASEDLKKRGPHLLIK